jgi:hypothetical protein
MSSGGWIYHLRALRNGGKRSDSLWAQHRERVESFLKLWNPSRKTLVLVGPSGGYSLPKVFLEGFEQVIAVEPDPLARIIFQKRFGLKNIRWVKVAFPFQNPESFTKEIPVDSSILFCNLLGQLNFRRTSEIKKKLSAFLAPFRWASFHDALSGENLEFDTELAQQERQATLSQMKTWIYPKVSGGTLEVNAHQAPDLFSAGPQTKFYYWQWRINSKRTHLIEGVFHDKT